MAVIIVNFKDYEEANLENAVKLAEVCESVAKDFPGVKFVVAVHPVDLYAVCDVVGEKLCVISESGDSLTRGVDGKVKGTQTGRMTPAVIKRCGGKGALINHAENPASDEEIAAIVTDFELEDKALLTVVCAESVERAATLKELCDRNGLSVDYFAIEPSELIGGDVSVTTRPEIISDAVSRLGDNVLVGAGVKTGDDVRKALELGAAGVLLASGVVKPKSGSPESVLRELASACNQG